MPAIVQPTPTGDKSFTHIQNAPSASWDITHNLGKRPSVTVQDTAGTECVGSVDHISSNRLVITFTAAFAGRADLN